MSFSELSAEDPLEENMRKPLTLSMSPDSTFEDLKLQIQEEEEYEPEEQQLLVGFCPVEDMNMKLQVCEKILFQHTKYIY